MDKQDLWTKHFPELAQSVDEEIQQIVYRSQCVTVPAKTTVFAKGTACENYLLVADGRVKVVVFTESGREAVLYRVLPGETCVLTTSCLLASTQYNAEGITETATTALLIDQQQFQKALDHSAIFRRFVFADLGKRFADVIEHLEQIKFTNIDQRLAKALLKHADDGLQVRVTHQDLANEISSGREVVSRHLKRYEVQGLLELHRGYLNVKEREKLEAVAAGSFVV